MKSVSEVEARFGQKLQEVSGIIKYENLPFVKADETLLTQVIQNFVANGLKFKGSDNPIITITAEFVDPFWKIRIKDNGIGIEKEHQEKIFQLFKRLHFKEEYEGTGIGLAVCKKIIELFGGEIGVESEFGKGSCFWFTLKKADQEK